MPNWEYAAGILWPILTDAAKEGKKFTYSEIAPRIDTNPHSVGRALGPIQAFCLDEKIPPLTSIVVSKSTGLPSEGFIGWDIDDIDEAYEKVFQYNWDAAENPFGGFDENDTTEKLAEKLLKRPGSSRKIYAKVKVRGTVQKIFREALLTAYEWECSMCGLSFVEALEAAHIVRWSEASDDEKISLCNGILLCSNHHKLFDNEWIEISKDYKVRHIYDESYPGDYSKADKAATVAIDGNHLRLPKNKKLWPSLKLIRKKQGKN